jgi:hypothetical protein
MRSLLWAGAALEGAGVAGFVAEVLAGSPPPKSIVKPFSVICTL